MPDAFDGVPLWILKATVLALGATFGSFANVVIYRLPLGRSIVYPGSACAKCETPIKWFDNIPVISYMLLLGKCRVCKDPISIRYPLIEVSGAVLSLACLLLAINVGFEVADLAGLAVLWAFFFAFCFLLLVITFIDLEHWWIPPSLVLPGIAIGLLTNILLGDLTRVSWLDALIGMVAGALPIWLIRVLYFKIRGHEGMGLGDVFLMAMVGAMLGYVALPFVLLAASIQGLIVAIPLSLKKKISDPPWEPEEGHEHQETMGKTAVPFGPFIALGALQWLFFGNAIAALLFQF